MSPLIQIANNIQQRWSRMIRRPSTSSQDQHPQQRQKDARQQFSQSHGFASSCSTIESVVVDFSASTPNVNSGFNPEVASSFSSCSSSGSTSTSNSFYNRAQGKFSATRNWLSTKVSGGQSQ